MLIFPAIDLVQGKAVRLFKGDYSQMTIYSENPFAVAQDFEAAGATHIHLVDLEGAKDGTTPNIETVLSIAQNTNLFTEIGGGIRDMKTVDAYLGAGVDRVILGTAAIKDPAFLREALAEYGNRVAVGADIKDGYIAVSGWLESSDVSAREFFANMQELGVDTIICTDISKDGAMQGTNRALYEELSRNFKVNITASGGVSSMDDVRALKAMGLYAAIIGKAYYTGAIDLAQAVQIGEAEALQIEENNVEYAGEISNLKGAGQGVTQ